MHRLVALLPLVLLATSTASTACGSRRVAYVDPAGGVRVVNEPVRVHGAIVRSSCAGRGFTYVDKRTGRQYVVDKVVHTRSRGR